jgi:HlyD family secretion protein
MIRHAGFLGLYRVVCSAICVGCLAITSAPAAETVIQLTGTVEPNAVVDVYSSVPGSVISFGADSGAGGKRITYTSPVKKGDVLAQLDPVGFELALKKAEALLKAAQAEVEVASAELTVAEQGVTQAESRAANKTGGTTDVEKAKSAILIARAKIEAKRANVSVRVAELEVAKNDLASCTIRSPIDGVILDIRRNVGQYLAAPAKDASLFLIADLSKFQVWASVPEGQIARVAVGQPVRFKVDPFPERKFTGRITQIRPNATLLQGKVFFTAVIDVDSGQDGLIPYLTADVEVIVETKDKSS